MNTIFLIIGESGSGKTLLTTALEKKHELKPVPSYTTRKPRFEGEEGHIFVSDEEFDNLTDIVAYTEFCGNRYAATALQVDESDIYVIDAQGIEFFKKAYRGKKEVRVIYIKSPLHTRFERMEGRGDSFPKVLERIINDVSDFKDAEKYADYIVYNDDDTKFCNLVEQVWEYIRMNRD